MVKDWNFKGDTTLRDLGEKMSRESLEKVKMNLENKLPFGPEDEFPMTNLLEVYKFGTGENKIVDKDTKRETHVKEMFLNREDGTTVELSEGMFDKEFILKEALKRRWEFLKNVLSNEIDRYENQNCFTDDEASWSDGVAEGLSMALSEVERCIGSLFRKEADK